MSDLTPGIHAEAPGGWKAKRVNFKGLFTELGKATGKGAGGAALAYFNVPGGWGAIISAVPDVVAAIGNVGTLTEGERAYILVQRAIARAIAELVSEANVTSLPDKAVGEGILEQSEAAIVDILLAPDFLQRPREIALLKDAKSLLERWLITYGMSAFQAQLKAEPLPIYFQLALHEEMTKHADFYAPLRNMLKLETAPLNQEEWNWQRYRAEILREPHRPLFDEKFGLAKIFVPLRAEWYEIRRASIGEGQFPHTVSLEAELTEWALRGAKEDCLRILSGDPGSGKSSCAKMWAATMAEAHTGWRVVFVPLHRFGYKGDLRENLKTYLKDEARIEVDLLDPHCPDPTLLFFDGLDELAMQGKSARQAAGAFVREVIGMLSVQNRDRRRVLVLLGGRQLVVQDCNEELRKPRQVLHLQPYSEEERAQWWRKYGKATGQVEKYTDLPRELNRDDLESITVQPLLNYLLALSYDRKKLDFLGDVTVNDIYADLLDRVYERVWGPDNPHLHGANQTLPQEEFEEILEEIGIAVWQSDSRSATLESIRDRCKDVGLSDALAKLENEPDAGVFRLLTAFHFRFKEGGEGSVEFTHKSFGEYLAARRICRLIIDITEQRETWNPRRNRGWSSTEALTHWAKLCGQQALDSSDLNLYVMLGNEMATLSPEDRAKSLDVFTELVEEMLLQGMPMEQCGLTTYAEMDQQARNAEEALLCALYACFPANIPGRSRGAFVTKGPSLINRWHFRRAVEYWRLGFACVVVLKYLGYTFTLANLSGADLTRADLSGAELMGANLTQADLTEADLRGANLTEADLMRANLTGANLTGAGLTGANLTGADLTGVRGWKEAIGLNIEQVSPGRRPEDWEEVMPGTGGSSGQSEESVPGERTLEGLSFEMGNTDEGN